jgi:uncharacterized protein (DUF2336 family)
MPAPQPLLAELEDAIHSGSQDRRVEMLRRVTDLFLGDADRLNENQIAVFDDVLCHLVKRIETKAIAELSSRLAPVDNAPIELIRRLARDDSIAVAQPVLSRSARLTNDDLVEIANSKGQPHLLAIAERQNLSSVVTDVLVVRGDRDVRYKLADNRGASFSESGFTILAKSAENDDGLIERIGLRMDLPLRLLKELLQKATEAVRTRLLSLASPEQRENIQQTLSKISSDLERELAKPRDLKRAVARIALMTERGQLDEEQLLVFARTRQIDDVIAALAALTTMPAELVAPVVKSPRVDGLLVVCKAAGLRWSTAKTILTSRIIQQPMTETETAAAEQEYLHLSQGTAQRTLRFWKVRQAGRFSGDEQSVPVRLQ